MEQQLPLPNNSSLPLLPKPSFWSKLARKKVLLPLAILLVGGIVFWFFYPSKNTWQINQKLGQEIVLRENKISKEYRILNQADNYQLGDLKKVLSVNYLEKRDLGEYQVASLLITTEKGLISVDSFNQKEFSLEEWTNYFLADFNLELLDRKTGIFGENAVIIGEEDKHLGGSVLAFVKTPEAIHVLTGKSREEIERIIKKSKWQN